MGLAEALLRTPDATTRDRLIAEKIGAADWAAHLGQSDSLFVNASTWGLMLTGRLIDIGGMDDGPVSISRLVARVGEPIVRTAVAQAMRIMGEQFVLGRTIEAAMARAASERSLCSFDMLGEGARTESDAERYEAAYAAAIRRRHRQRPGAGPENAHGISVKLSALSPRYEATQEAARLGRTLSAPEAAGRAGGARPTSISPSMPKKPTGWCCRSSCWTGWRARQSLGAWRGLGPGGAGLSEARAGGDRGAGDAGAGQRPAADGAAGQGRLLGQRDQARPSGRQPGLSGVHHQAGDRSVLSGLRRGADRGASRISMPSSPPTMPTPWRRCAPWRRPVAIEHQRLHGMGEALYRRGGGAFGPLSVRTYAPVGAHEDLLPYLVRRLLENGANTSFVHLLLDDETPPEKVARDPITLVEAQSGPHPRIPLPARSLWRPAQQRRRRFQYCRSYGIALAAREPHVDERPIVNGMAVAAAPLERVENPFDSPRLAGLPRPVRRRSTRPSPPPIRRNRPGTRAAASAAPQSCAPWRDALEAHRGALGGALPCARRARPGPMRSAKCARRRISAAITRCWRNGFRRAAQSLKGPAGETNALELHGRGVFACIQPWNFPLAIFTGQIAAALAAGNARAGQTGRADAPDRRRGGAAVPRRPACRPMSCICCRAAARPWARR